MMLWWDLWTPHLSGQGFWKTNRLLNDCSYKTMRTRFWVRISWLICRLKFARQVNNCKSKCIWFGKPWLLPAHVGTTITSDLNFMETRLPVSWLSLSCSWQTQPWWKVILTMNELTEFPISVSTKWTERINSLAIWSQTLTTFSQASSQQASIIDWSSKRKSYKRVTMNSTIVFRS